MCDTHANIEHKQGQCPWLSCVPGDSLYLGHGPSLSRGFPFIHWAALWLSFRFDFVARFSFQVGLWLGPVSFFSSKWSSKCYIVQARAHSLQLQESAQDIKNVKHMQEFINSVKHEVATCGYRASDFICA